MADKEHEATCRICFGDGTEGKLLSPCLCKGSMRFVHVECLQRWRLEREKVRRSMRKNTELPHWQFLSGLS